MILRPQSNSPRHGTGFVPVWEAIRRAQQANSATYQLVRQPHHALLSGQLVERFTIPQMPQVTEEIVRGISLHDEGWAAFDSGSERLRATSARYSGANVALNAAGKPLCFLDIKAGDFLRAWQESIEAAEAVAPIAGLMVSGHFFRLGKFGVSAGAYNEEDTRRINEFLEGEESRRQRLLLHETRSREEVEYWTDVLQFCDLLSLFLCCGSEESVEFPQQITADKRTVNLHVSDGVYALSPSPFAEEVEFSLGGYAFDGAENHLIRLTWRVR